MVVRCLLSTDVDEQERQRLSVALAPTATRIGYSRNYSRQRHARRGRGGGEVMYRSVGGSEGPDQEGGRGKTKTAKPEQNTRGGRGARPPEASA